MCGIVIRLRMNSGQPRGVLGKIILSLFLFVVLALGVVFSYVIGQEVARSAATCTWTRTECPILSSAVKDGEGNNSYSFEVRFPFEWNGVLFGCCPPPQLPARRVNVPPARATEVRDEISRPQHFSEDFRSFVGRRFVGDAAQAQPGGIVAQQVDVHPPRAE